MMNNERIGWVSEPTGRGTAGLIYNCLFTIFLCTWTAYHPDVPGPTWSWMKRFWKRLDMMMLFIYLPEAMIYAAMNELNAAIVLKEIAKQHVSSH
jgi:hypothetical protein